MLENYLSKEKVGFNFENLKQHNEFSEKFRLLLTIIEYYSYQQHFILFPQQHFQTIENVEDFLMLIYLQKYLGINYHSGKCAKLVSKRASFDLEPIFDLIPNLNFKCVQRNVFIFHKLLTIICRMIIFGQRFIGLFKSDFDILYGIIPIWNSFNLMILKF